MGASATEVARALQVNPNVVHRWRRESWRFGAQAFGGYGNSRTEVAPRTRAVMFRLTDVEFDNLEKARARISTDSSYDFSVEVSDILRSFIEQQFGIRAVRQTTIEFLNEASQTSYFDLAHQEKLRHFLVTCDAIKFARVDAGQAESEALFDQASAFVEEAK